MEIWGSFAAVLVSVITGAIGWYSQRKLASKHYVYYVEGRVGELEQRIEECENDRAALRDLVTKLESQTNVAVVVANEDGVIIDWSPEATLLFRYIRADAIGKNIKILIPDSLMGKHESSFKKLVATRKVPLRSLDTDARDSHGYAMPVHIELSGWEKSGKLFIEARITRR